MAFYTTLEGENHVFSPF